MKRPTLIHCPTNPMIERRQPHVGLLLVWKTLDLFRSLKGDHFSLPIQIEHSSFFFFFFFENYVFVPCVKQTYSENGNPSARISSLTYMTSLLCPPTATLIFGTCSELLFNVFSAVLLLNNIADFFVIVFSVLHPVYNGHHRRRIWLHVGFW